ncbi:hypothetical protein NL676_001731 [Syzygium grande]|nr:hypothetical protein NL676_001731 [Syzygium grande]
MCGCVIASKDPSLGDSSNCRGPAQLINGGSSTGRGQTSRGHRSAAREVVAQHEYEAARPQARPVARWRDGEAGACATDSLLLLALTHVYLTCSQELSF